jgi:hypothetical protein
VVQNASSGAVTRQLEDVVSMPGVAIKPPPPPAVSDRFCLRWGNGLGVYPPEPEIAPQLPPTVLTRAVAPLFESCVFRDDASAGQPENITAGIAVAKRRRGGDCAAQP